jgi:hypothetical protein
MRPFNCVFVTEDDVAIATVQLHSDRRIRMGRNFALCPLSAAPPRLADEAFILGLEVIAGKSATFRFCALGTSQRVFSEQLTARSRRFDAAITNREFVRTRPKYGQADRRGS